MIAREVDVRLVGSERHVARVWREVARRDGSVGVLEDNS